MTLSGLMVLSKLGSDVSGRLQSYSFFFVVVLRGMPPLRSVSSLFFFVEYAQCPLGVKRLLLFFFFFLYWVRRSLMSLSVDRCQALTHCYVRG